MSIPIFWQDELKCRLM